MSRRCVGCGHVLRLPSPDGLGPVCRVRLAGHTATARIAPSAPAAGQLPLEDHMTEIAPTLRYTDDDAVTLTVLPIPDASSYYGPIPVVSLGIVDHRWDDDAEPAIVHVRVDAVDELIAALSKARDEAKDAGPKPAPVDPVHILGIDHAEPAAETRQCGHDDYHDGHPWHDRPTTWCPGHTDN